MQSAAASGTCPDILNSHSHLLMKDISPLISNRFGARNSAAAWSVAVRGDPVPTRPGWWYVKGMSPGSSFICLLCLCPVLRGGTGTPRVLVLQRAFVSRLAPATLAFPRKICVHDAKSMCELPRFGSTCGITLRVSLSTVHYSLSPGAAGRFRRKPDAILRIQEIQKAQV